MKYKNQEATEAYNKLMAEVNDGVQSMISFLDDAGDLSEKFGIVRSIAQYKIESSISIIESVNRIDHITSQSKAVISETCRSAGNDGSRYN